MFFGRPSPSNLDLSLEFSSNRRFTVRVYRTFLSPRASLYRFSGSEPATFIGLFDNWNHNLLRDYKSFETFFALLEDRDQPARTQTAVKATTDFDNYVKYPLAVLKSEPENLPSGVDVQRKEMHLTFDNFIAIFKMEPAEFEKLPTWKRQRLKQTAGLF